MCLNSSLYHVTPFNIGLLAYVNEFSLLLQAILDVMVNLQFTLVETLWKTFWRFSQSQAGDAALSV